MITPESMGRASTFFNTMRQVGSATGVAILSTVLIGVGSTQAAGGDAAPDMTAYHLAFLTAAVFALVGAGFSLTIHDSDAAETIVRRRASPGAGPGARCRSPRAPGVTHPRAVCVFCGSSPAPIRPSPRRPGRSGHGLARRGIGLVYGGASVGLMGVVADAAIAAGGWATGVITESLAGHEIAHSPFNDLHVVTTMHERKALMSELSDAFVMLPGGFGTCEEFMESVTWTQLGIHDKRCGMLNVDGFFDDLLAFLGKPWTRVSSGPDSYRGWSSPTTPTPCSTRSSDRPTIRWRRGRARSRTTGPGAAAWCRFCARPRCFVGRRLRSGGGRDEQDVAQFVAVSPVGQQRLHGRVRLLGLWPSPEATACTRAPRSSRGSRRPTYPTHAAEHLVLSSVVTIGRWRSMSRVAPPTTRPSAPSTSIFKKPTGPSTTSSRRRVGITTPGWAREVAAVDQAAVGSHMGRVVRPARVAVAGHRDHVDVGEPTQPQRRQQ